MASFRGAVLLGSAALLIATLGVTAGIARDGPLARVAAPAEPSASWQRERMNLGAPRDEPASAEPAEPMRRLERCRRWRDAASGLGETFAGYSLRAAFGRGRCALLAATEGLKAPVWSWPWSTLDAGLGLPPRLHLSFGEWQIRCGDGPARTRCALIHQAEVSSGEPPYHPQADVITTHFVIDRVAGREILLWRLFVPKQSGLLASAQGNTANRAGELTGTAAGDAGVRARGLTARLKIGSRRQSLRFTVCKAGGCMIEIGGARAGKMATGLAAGHRLPVDLFLGTPGAVPVVIGAEGFAQGLAELMRQRRAERHLNAPR